MSAFETAAAAIKASATTGIKMTNDELLSIYGLYKQGLEGDNTTAEPWAVQVQKKAKWSAWTSHKGKSKEAAQTEYVKVARELLTKYGLPANF